MSDIIMSLEKILRNMKITELKKEISKTNVRGYSKLKKEDIINLMLKYPKRFMYLVDKPDVKKPEVKKPDVKKPDVKKPEVKKPEKQGPVIGQKIIVPPDTELIKAIETRPPEFDDFLKHLEVARMLKNISSKIKYIKYIKILKQDFEELKKNPYYKTFKKFYNVDNIISTFFEDLK
jgi:hypothetical protein